MKNISIFILTLLLFSNPVFAQIGVQTSSFGPDILLNFKDQVYVTKAGNVGINESNPKVKLSLHYAEHMQDPPLMIDDGSLIPSPRYFRSNAKGQGYWDEYNTTSFIGSFGSGVNIKSGETGYVNTKAKITLDPGKWIIMYTISFDSTVDANQPDFSRVYVVSTIGDGDDSVVRSSDIIGATNFSTNFILGQKNSINGKCIVNNTTNSTKQYNILVGHLINGMGFNGVVQYELKNVGAKGQSFLCAFLVKETQ